MPTKQKGNRWKTDFGLKGERYVQYFDTQAEGEAWEMLVRYLVSQGKSLDDALPKKREAMSLGQAHDLALEHWKGTKNELNAAANARDIVNFLGSNTPVREVGKECLDSLVKHLRNREHESTKGRKAQPLSNATINRKLAALSTMLRVAQERGEPITVRIKQLKEGEGRIRFLTREEEAQVVSILANHKGQTMANFVSFAIETGGRLSEMLALRVKHVARRADGVFLTFPGEYTKSGKTRSVPLTDKAVSLIADKLNGSPNDTLWPADWNKYTVTHAWALARGKMGLQGDDEFVFHACRHTCATRLLEATGNLELVRVWLGHSDIRVTTRYAKVVTTSLLGAVTALNNLPTHTPMGG
jgi:integrase